MRLDFNLEQSEQKFKKDRSTQDLLAGSRASGQQSGLLLSSVFWFWFSWLWIETKSSQLELGEGKEGRRKHPAHRHVPAEGHPHRFRILYSMPLGLYGAKGKAFTLTLRSLENHSGSLNYKCCWMPLRHLSTHGCVLVVLRQAGWQMQRSAFLRRKRVLWTDDMARVDVTY